MSKKENAEAWVAGYVVLAGTVAANPIPGTTTGWIIASQGIMCLHIGRVYLGELYTLEEAWQTAAHIGLATLVGRALASEAIGLFPVLGWGAKAVVAGSITAIMGKMIVNYFELNYASRPIP